MATVLDKTLYAKVKRQADAKFLAPTSAYRSSWLVKTYKKLGGRYAASSAKSRANIGLTKWFASNWVDLTRPVHDAKGTLLGYYRCGRREAQACGAKGSGAYPYCRPISVAEKMTPAQVKRACASKQRKMSR